MESWSGSFSGIAFLVVGIIAVVHFPTVIVSIIIRVCVIGVGAGIRSIDKNTRIGFYTVRQTIAVTVGDRANITDAVGVHIGLVGVGNSGTVIVATGRDSTRTGIGTVAFGDVVSIGIIHGIAFPVRRIVAVIHFPTIVVTITIRVGVVGVGAGIRSAGKGSRIRFNLVRQTIAITIRRSQTSPMPSESISA